MPNRHRLILVQPEIPENIGFVVRAMSCFGWNDLALVGTQKPDPDSVAAILAPYESERALEAWEALAREHP